jgi:hypothetical protein
MCAAFIMREFLFRISIVNSMVLEWNDTQRLTLAGGIGIVLGLFHALAFVHERGIIRRDVSDGNLLLFENHIHVLFSNRLVLVAPQIVRNRPTAFADDVFASGRIMDQLKATFPKGFRI